MLRTNAVKTAISLLALIIIPSCSVKENRDVCPCTLTIDLSQCGNGQTVELVGYSGESSFQRTVQTSADNNKVKQRVTKGIVHLCAYLGIAEMDVIDNKLLVPKGSQCDSLYMCSYEIECKKEEAIDTITLHKQFASITIDFIDSADDAFPFQIAVNGMVNGIDFRTLNPLPGEFEFHPEGEGEFGRRFRVRVPRQTDSSLSIAIYKDKRFLDSLNIGEEIKAKGFDWSKEDLDDITINIDYSHNEMYVRIIDWIPTDEKNVII